MENGAAGIEIKKELNIIQESSKKESANGINDVVLNGSVIDTANDAVTITEDVLMAEVEFGEGSQNPDDSTPDSANAAKRNFAVVGVAASSETTLSTELTCEEEDFGEKDPVIDSRLHDPAWQEERRHYQKVVATFRSYSEHNLRKLGGTSRYLKKLPKEHQRLLIDYRRQLHEIKRCVEENQNLCSLIVQEESHLFENQNEYYPEKRTKQVPPQPTNFDFDKVEAVFKQIVRDWSDDGKAERDSCYKPLIEEIEHVFGDTKNEEGLSSVRILVPGAGLGRLAHELVCKGYTVEGNEFSLFMLFASNFLLNKCDEENQYKCFPWIHQTTNVLNRTDQIRSVQFPDIKPCDLPPKSKFSMTAGDFLEVYGTKINKEGWDCIATCFFIDCANNIVAYLEGIYYCLKLGGLWVNIGPLLYHYADLAEENSIEPSYDVLRVIIQKMGFVIEKEEINRPTLYCDNSKSMLSYTYNSVFLVCRKGLPIEPSSDCSSVTSSPTKSVRSSTS